MVESEFEHINNRKFFVDEVALPKEYLEKGIVYDKPVEMSNYFFGEASKLARYAVGSVEKL